MSDADVPANASLPQAGPPSKLLGLLGFVAVGLLSVGGLFTYDHWAAEPAPERAESLGAKLELAAGDVVLLRPDDTTDGVGERLLSGTPLPLGASVRTGEGSRALVRLSDGSRVFLNESSAIEIGKDTGITVHAGQVWLETQPLDPKRDPLVHTVGPATLTLSDGGASLTLTNEGASVYVAEGVGWVTGVGAPKEVRTGEEALVGIAGAPKVEPVAFWDDWTGGMGDRRAGARIGGGSGCALRGRSRGPAGTPALPLTYLSARPSTVAIEPRPGRDRGRPALLQPLPSATSRAGTGSRSPRTRCSSGSRSRPTASSSRPRSSSAAGRRRPTRRRSQQRRSRAARVDRRPDRARAHLPGPGRRRPAGSSCATNSCSARPRASCATATRSPAPIVAATPPTIEEFSLRVELRGELASATASRPSATRGVEDDDELRDHAPHRLHPARRLRARADPQADPRG